MIIKNKQKFILKHMHMSHWTAEMLVNTKRVGKARNEY